MTGWSFYVHLKAVDIIFMPCIYYTTQHYLLTTAVTWGLSVDSDALNAAVVGWNWSGFSKDNHCFAMAIYTPIKCFKVHAYFQILQCN